MRKTKFLTFTFIGFSTLMLATIGFNALIDPLDIMPFKVQSWFNQEKPALANNIRAFKAYEIAKIKPQTLILGSSRAQIGLDASSTVFEHSPVYNTGLPRSTIDEQRDYLIYAHQISPIKEVLLSIDFFSFNAYLKSMSPFKWDHDQLASFEPFSWQDKLASIVGWDGLQNSVQTIRANRQQQVITAVTAADMPNLQSALPMKRRFEKSERFYIEQRVYLPYPRKIYEFSNDSAYSSFETFQELLQFCQAQHIKVNIVILPVHARQMLLVQRLGLWSKYTEWKVAVAKIAHDVLEQPIYDFTGLTAIQTEPVPDYQDANQSMRYFIDSAHITKELGTQIMNEVAAQKLSFGMILTPDTVDNINAVQTQQLQAYDRDATLMLAGLVPEQLLRS